MTIHLNKLPNYLSKQEKNVFGHLLLGLTVKEIANLLKLSPQTIGAHKYNLYTKLWIHSIQELIHLAYKCGVCVP